MTITLTPEGPRDLLGSYTASTSFTLCGTPLPTRTVSGGVLGAAGAPGSDSLALIFVYPGQGASLWPFTGTVDRGITGLLITGGQVFGSLTEVTGGITATSSLQTASSDGQPVYT